MSNYINNKPKTIAAKLNSLKLNQKFMLVLTLMFLIFVGLGFFTEKTYNKVIVNGETYTSIIANKDLVADILPPPAYLVESYQVALEMLALKDRPIQPLVDKSAVLTQEFRQRIAYWKERLTNPKMLEVLNTQVERYGLEFIRVRDQEFIPAIRSADPDTMIKAFNNLKLAYEKHRLGVDLLTKLATEDAKQIEINTSSSILATKLIILVIGLLGFAILFVVMRYLSGTIIKPLNKTITVFDAIEQGRFDSAINVTGNDELGHVMTALKKMQSVLEENLEKEKVVAKQLAEQSALFQSQLNAINHSMGMIEFTLDGKVTAVNDIFLKVIGYSRDEIIGLHHSTFVTPDYRTSPAYQDFWQKLKRGEFIADQFKRIAKNGKEIWLQATYSPILSSTGEPYKVVKYAADITEQKSRNADYEGQITAINKSQGVIEIGLDGVILKANDIYLDMLGYTEQELVGKNVSTVLDPEFLRSGAYKTLWDKLVNGGTDVGQYKRIGKGGKEVWIQASYNPIYDLNGKPYKIVNYTIDVTEQKLLAASNAGKIAAIDKIQGVIQFDLKGNIISVNNNFAAVTGYTSQEIVGKHHSILVDANYKSSAEYKEFWESLARGEANEGQYQRFGKGGKEIWLQASYNPIFDLNGKPYMVVKYATDITLQYKTARALEHAVQEIKTVVASTRVGDLSPRVTLNDKSGEVAALCQGVNALIAKMTEIILQVKEAAEAISTAAGQISSGNNDLANRTEQQASSLENTASSMEELAATVKNNAENAKQANQLSTVASGVAVKGGEVVTHVVNTMNAINQSAHKIEDIISVIDGIAFQTNILALNAAVEAARAGEQGRGFAVVAGEVRNLAQRSASAAKEIKELITDSVNKTSEGTKQVEMAGATMQEIVSSVQRVTDIMGEITAASVEQSSGIGQVNTAITSMDEVTQQNAALVEEASNAAQSLVDQAMDLVTTVNAFKLREELDLNKETGTRLAIGANLPAVKRPQVQASVAVKNSASQMSGSDHWEEF